ncbi:MAG: sigma 54-interacting transcriptional regulator [Planctomycetota bacterium]|jgi:Nif-specific regulatory protein|nr:sigma 54-interacting transcriptional regulator [Planctomycetota bacterium]
MHSSNDPKDHEWLRLFYEISNTFAQGHDLRDVLAQVVRSCQDLLEADGVSILFLDEEKRELYFPYVAQSGSAASQQLKDLRFPMDRGIAGSVIASGEAILVEDVQNDDRFYSEVDQMTGLETRTILAAPLRCPRGILGVLEAINPGRSGNPLARDLDFLTSLSGSVALAFDNALFYQDLKSSEERFRTEAGVLRRELARRDRDRRIIGESEGIHQVLNLMEVASGSPLSVLIHGETGTGKELVARGIHLGSARSKSPFLAVNCAAFPENLLESELFGHSQGAFTGADQDRQGIFEAASGGTVFLDEAGEMSPTMQAKLLRVLQENEVTRLGETQPRKLDIRLLCASNRDLESEIIEGSFREDLYYRIAGFPISIPPLRDRLEDIPEIAAHIVSLSAKQHHKKIVGFHPEVLRLLQNHDWPGNVRELQNELERAVAFCSDGESIQPHHLSQKLGGSTPSGPSGQLSRPAASIVDECGQPIPFKDARKEFEKRYLRDALGAHGGNVSHTAQSLRVSRVTLQKKMKEYGLREGSESEDSGSKP